MSATLATAIAGNGVGRAQQAVGTQFEELFDGVDDLIKRVADVENPEIRRTRARVHAAMVAARRVAAMGVAAKSAYEDGANQLPPQTVQVADRTDGYLRDYPGQALGVALLLGIGVGLIVSGRQ
jgi:ElaB/YqjD/DUF883 family membrane-anchored ribosome-binding protein